jgi:protein ImuB
MEALAEVLPQMERTAVHTAIGALDGMESLLGPPSEMASFLRRRLCVWDSDVRIAVASNPDAAFFAAHGFPGITVIPPGKEAEVLAPLPLKLLPADPGILNTLRQWGLRTFRDLAALPENGLVARLGPDASRLWRLARGEQTRALRICRSPTIFEETIDLDYEIEQIEPLLFLLARKLNALCERLTEHGVATCELTLALNGKTRVYRLPVPTRNPRTFLKLIQLDLEAHPAGESVSRIVLRAAPADPRPAQSGLFSPPRPEPEKLAITLARIGAIVGPQNAGVSEVLNTHRSDAFRILPPSPAQRRSHSQISREVEGSYFFSRALRRYRPPKPCDWPVIQRRAIRISGPWRTSGEWWTPQPWDRDEYDVTLPGGTLCLIFRDNRTGLWFLDGQYD